jgi:hypothetical protein
MALPVRLGECRRRRLGGQQSQPASLQEEDRLIAERAGTVAALRTRAIRIETQRGLAGHRPTSSQPCKTPTELELIRERNGRGPYAGHGRGGQVRPQAQTSSYQQVEAIKLATLRKPRCLLHGKVFACLRRPSAVPWWDRSHSLASTP